MADERRDVGQALADSLKVLAKKVPFEKITIKQITDGAGVTRITFYNHYQDKYDLLGAILRKEILEPVGILLKNDMYKEALTLIFTNLKKDSAFYQKVVKLEGQNSFEEISEECIYELLLELFNGKSSDKPNSRHPLMTIDSLARYYARSMNYVVMYWIRSGMTVPPEEVTLIYDYLVNRSLWDIYKEL